MEWGREEIGISLFSIVTATAPLARAALLPSDAGLPRLRAAQLRYLLYGNTLDWKGDLLFCLDCMQSASPR